MAVHTKGRYHGTATAGVRARGAGAAGGDSYTACCTCVARGAPLVEGAVTGAIYDESSFVHHGTFTREGRLKVTVQPSHQRRPKSAARVRRPQLLAMYTRRECVFVEPLPLRCPRKLDRICTAAGPAIVELVWQPSKQCVIVDEATDETGFVHSSVGASAATLDGRLVTSAALGFCLVNQPVQ